MKIARVRPVLRTIRRSATVPLLGLVTGIVAATGLTAVLPETYEATASMLVMPGQAEPAGGGSGGDLGLAQGVAPSVARLAESREVALRTAKALRLPDDQVAGHLAGVFEPGIQIVTVHSSAPTAQGAAQMADAASTAIRDLTVQLHLGGNSAITVDALDAASVPTQPVSPKPLLNTALGALVGLLVALALASLRSRVDDRFRRVDDIETALGLPALGVLPLAHSLSGGLRLPGRRVVEAAIDGTLAALTVLDPERLSRRIVVTSVGDPDSAAAVATLLAAGLYRHEIRTTLIESRRRPPRARRYLKGRPVHTVEEVLVGRRAMTDALVVLPAAAVRDYLESAIRPGSRMGALVDVLAASGDHVVTTAPPVLAGTDLASLSRHADAVLLVVASDQARKAEAGRAAWLVARLGVPLAGLVVVGGAAHADGWQLSSWSGSGLPVARAERTEAAHPEPLLGIGSDPRLASLAGASRRAPEAWAHPMAQPPSPVD